MAPSAEPPVLILGGYGTFGGRIARLLLAEGIHPIIAGRSLEKAEAFCARHGGTPLNLARDEITATRLAALAPGIVIDAAGPFQAYEDNSHQTARAAIAAGAHYLDLSDDPGFTARITQLDASARAAGVTALSGVSSVPAISAAAVRALTQEWRHIETIETAILPGNRAPRGLSVVRAILAQAGKPLRIWRDGAWQPATGWSSLRKIQIEGLPPRWSSLINVPDLALFPAEFGARTVEFRAGLELWILHLGLSCAALPVRIGLLPSLARLAPIAHWIASRLERFGTDRGGMRVAVAGKDHQGRPQAASWTLVAEAGDGPWVPALPGAILARQLLQGRLAVGARPALSDLTLEDLAQAISCHRLQISLDPRIAQAGSNGQGSQATDEKGPR